MKKVLKILFSFMLITQISCGKTSSKTTQPTTDEPIIAITTPQDDMIITEEKDVTANMELTLKIGNTLVDVFWIDNESVKDLKRHAKDELTIELHQYGNFEQTGLLGFNLISNDTQMSVGPGDIVLYNSNQI